MNKTMKKFIMVLMAVMVLGSTVVVPTSIENDEDEFFESVTFAILYDKDKISVFNQVFREKIENNISSR